MLSGLLFFPVTPFLTSGMIDEQALGDHISIRVDAGAGAVFAVCGTGEFHALTVAEHAAASKVAVVATGGRVPVFVGVGGAIAQAEEQMRNAADAGVDGVLLLPPYLVSATQRGLVAYVARIAAAADLPVIVYQRGIMLLTPESVVELASIPNVVGFKDGVGDITLMVRTVTAVREAGFHEFQFFNGLSTAEVTMPAYKSIGVGLYSSAVFAFAPDISLAFSRALEADNQAAITVLLREFFVPFVSLRDREPGYQVSLVKAGVPELANTSVRAPLTAPSADTLASLERLLVTARDSFRAQGLLPATAHNDTAPPSRVKAIS